MDVQRGKGNQVTPKRGTCGEGKGSEWILEGAGDGERGSVSRQVQVHVLKVSCCKHLT